jgi:hypothetical protein
MQRPEETFFAERMEDALKSRSLEESMRVRDPSELIAESTETEKT